MTDYDEWKTTAPAADEKYDRRVEAFYDAALLHSKCVMFLWPTHDIPPAVGDGNEEIDGPLFEYYQWWMGNNGFEDDEGRRLEFRFMVAGEATDLFAKSGRNVTEAW